MFLTESFADASGNQITMSLSDLFTLIGGSSSLKNTPAAKSLYDSTIPSTPSTTSSQSSLDSQFYSGLKDTILTDVRQTVRDTLQKSGGVADNAGNVLTDSCIDSAVAQQGAEFMRYIPGKNPADYIRKDSIPCYSCSIPT